MLRGKHAAAGGDVNDTLAKVQAPTVKSSWYLWVGELIQDKMSTISGFQITLKRAWAWACSLKCKSTSVGMFIVYSLCDRDIYLVSSIKYKYQGLHSSTLHVLGINVRISSNPEHILPVSYLVHQRKRQRAARAVNSMFLKTSCKRRRQQK